MVMGGELSFTTTGEELLGANGGTRGGLLFTVASVELDGDGIKGLLEGLPFFNWNIL